jgi:hypothetical protein
MTLNQGGSLTQPCSGDDYEASLGKASGGFKASEAAQFLELLGKDNAATWLRAIDPVKTRRRSGGADYQESHPKQIKPGLTPKPLTASTCTPSPATRTPSRAPASKTPT